MKYPRFTLKITAFSLLELLGVTAIVIILAAFGIHSYINYVTQSRVDELWGQAEAAKLEVESQFLKNNSASSLITVDSGAAEYTTPTADFVKCVTIQNGEVVVRADPTKFNNKDIWIAWLPNSSSGTLNWTCTYSSDAAAYITDAANACAVNTCNQYSTWGTATAVDSTQTFWYFGTLNSAEVSSAFAQNCQVSGTMTGCAACYNYTNTDTTQRYMNFSLSTTTYNYQGALGTDPNWSSYSSWSYPYTYTVVQQTCMQQTRSTSSCATTTPYSADPSC